MVPRRHRGRGKRVGVSVGRAPRPLGVGERQRAGTVEPHAAPGLPKPRDGAESDADPLQGRLERADDAEDRGMPRPRALRIGRREVPRGNRLRQDVERPRIPPFEQRKEVRGHEELRDLLPIGLFDLREPVKGVGMGRLVALAEVEDARRAAGFDDGDDRRKPRGDVDVGLGKRGRVERRDLARTRTGTSSQSCRASRVTRTTSWPRAARPAACSTTTLTPPDSSRDSRTYAILIRGRRRARESTSTSRAGS